jgi:chloramphenicol 3-O phosphotransferase
MTPASLQPGVGLRPGEPDHRAAGAVPILYAALYESIAAHARLGLNVAVDVGHHERTNLVDAARRLAGLSVLFVGVRCPVEVIMERRRGSEPGRYATAIEAAVRWERAVHRWRYDLELDTARLAPEECAAAIGERLRAPNAPSAFAQFS